MGLERGIGAVGAHHLDAAGQQRQPTPLVAETRTGKHLAVAFEIVDEAPLAVYRVTAYETEP